MYDFQRYTSPITSGYVLFMFILYFFGGPCFESVVMLLGVTIYPIESFGFVGCNPDIHTLL